jgi:hypothetical protein
LRRGGTRGIHLERFVQALEDPSSGLTYSALNGVRKQSVEDVERLFGPGVISFMKRNQMKLNMWKLCATGEDLLMSVDCVKISADNFVMISFHIYLMNECLGTEIHWIFQHWRLTGMCMYIVYMYLQCLKHVSTSVLTPPPPKKLSRSLSIIYPIQLHYT